MLWDLKRCKHRTMMGGALKISIVLVAWTWSLHLLQYQVFSSSSCSGFLNTSRQSWILGLTLSAFFPCFLSLGCPSKLSMGESISLIDFLMILLMKTSSSWKVKCLARSSLGLFSDSSTIKLSWSFSSSDEVSCKLVRPLTLIFFTLVYFT